MRNSRRAQWTALVLSAVMAVAYLVLPHSSTTELVLYTGAVLVTVVAGVVGVRRLPANRLPWSLVVVALTSWLVAEAVWWWYASTGVETYPSLADVFFLGAYLPLGVAAGLLARDRSTRDAFAWLDAGLVAAVALVPLWAIFIDPIVTDTSSTWWERGVSVAYPLADVFVIGLAARLVLSRAGRSESGLLFVAGLLMTFTSDLWFAWQELGAGYEPSSPVDVAYVAGYALLAAAVLDPSAGVVRVAPQDDHHDHGRLVAVLLALALPQLALWWGLQRSGLIGLNVVSVAAAGTCLATTIVCVRQWTLVGRARVRQRDRDDTRLAAIVEHSSDAVLLVGSDGSILYASPAAEVIWGASGRPHLTDPFTPEQAAIVQAQFANATASPHGHVEVTVALDPDGPQRRVLDGTMRNLLHDDAVGAVVVTLHDVTAERDLAEQLTHRAFHDDLTGLANRALFVDRVAHALDRCCRRPEIGMAVLFVDLDEFKAVNDGLGHAAGDELIRHVADRLRECIRPADTIARIGGDEFAVLLEDIFTAKEAIFVAQRIQEMLALPVDVGSHSVTVPASIGIAPRSSSSTVSSMLSDADIAMYSAKSKGPGQVAVFDESLRLRSEHGLALRIDLPAALTAGQIRLEYQPIYRAAERRLVAYEALCRWDHPTLGPVNPRDIIAAAEDSGFITDLGAWLLREACRQASRWVGVPLGPERIHVNVAAAQLLRPEIVDDVTATLHEFGVSPGALFVEVTESALHDEVKVADVMHRLRSAGVRVAIDDFGTGYTSLAQMRRFPVDAVKIDSSFMAAVDRGDTGLARSVLGIAEALGLHTIAEGVETETQVRALVEMGCAEAQGFRLGRPESAAAIDARLGVAPLPTPTPVFA